MGEENNKVKMQTLYCDIYGMGKIQKIKNKFVEWFDYNKYAEKICEYNIRSVLANYYSGKELTTEEEDIIKQYIFFSSNFYAGKAEGPDLNDLRLKSCFGSGNFDLEELQLIKEIYENTQKQNNQDKICKRQ